MDQGFASPSSVLERLPRSVSRVPHSVPHAPVHVGSHPTIHTTPHATTHVPNAGANEVAGKSIAVAKDARQAAKLSPEQKQAAKWQGVKSTLMMPLQMEFFGMIAGFLAGKVGLQRARAAIRIALKAPAIALRDTSIGNLFRLPANFMKAAAKEAQEVAEEVTTKAAAKGKTVVGKTQPWAEVLEGRAKEMNASAAIREKAFAKSSMVTGLRSQVSGAIDSVGKSGIGKQFHGVMDGLMHSRKAAVATKHSKALEAAHAALTSESQGFFKSALNFLSFTQLAQPNKVAAGELSWLADGLHHSESLSGVAKVSHLKELSDKLTEVAGKKGVAADVAGRAENAAKALQKALGSAEALHTYESAAGGNLITMLKAGAKALARVPVLNLVVGGSALVGLVSVGVIANGENKEAKAAYKDLVADLDGDTKSTFLQELKAAQNKGRIWGNVKTGIKAVGEVADSAMWMNPAGAGGALMTAQMLPMFIENLIPGNTSLAAYVALGKDDHGEMKLEPAARIQCIKELSAVKAVVKANGGVYSRQNTMNAAEMVERKLTTSQIVQLLADDAAYAKLTAEVAAKHEAEAKATTANDNAASPVAPAATADVKHVAANDHHAQAAAHQAPVAAYQAPHLGAGAPSNLVVANDLELQGKVAVAHRHVG